MRFKTRNLKGNICICVFFILNILPIIKGCKLFNEEGEEVAFSSDSITEVKNIADRVDNKLIFKYSTQDVLQVSEVVSAQYITYEYLSETISVSVTEEYDTWEMYEEQDFDRFNITLNLQCADSSQEVVFLARVASNMYTNNYSPEFLIPDEGTGYEVTLPMPLGAGYYIAGNCGFTIEVIDYDYNQWYYKSSLEFETQGDDMGIQAKAEKTTEKKFSISLVTTRTINIEEPISFVLVAKDVPPDGSTEQALQSTVTITIIPDITASTPLSPLFSEALYPLEVESGSSMIEPATLTFIEGYNKAETTFTLKHGTGEGLIDYFQIVMQDDYVTLEQAKPFSDEILEANHGVLVLEAKREGNDRVGKTVIHVSLPGSQITTTTTGTTSEPCPTLPPVTECPTPEPCPTLPPVTECPTETECPECPTTETPTGTTSEPCSTLPPVTECPTPEPCPTEPECPDCPTTETPTECPPLTCPPCVPCTTTEATTESTTFPTDPPTTTPEQCPPVETCPPCTTDPPTTTPEECPPIETCPPCTTDPPTTTPEECPPVVTCPPEETCPTECPTESPPTTTECTPCATECPSTSTPEETTYPTECPTECPSTSTPDETTCPTECPPCATECPPTEGSTSTPEMTTTASTPWVSFKDDNIFVYVYNNIPGPIVQLSATASNENEEIVYEISGGEMVESFTINSKDGVLTTEGITEDTIIYVTASTTEANATAQVNIRVMAFEVCEDGEPTWKLSVQVREVEEEKEEEYDSCPEGYDCKINNFFPTVASEYFGVQNRKIVALKTIDCEDTKLFPDVHHTEIVLQMEIIPPTALYSTSSDATESEFKTALEAIGDVEFGRTLIKRLVINVTNVDEHVPDYNFDSPVTIGYPNKDIVELLLPPYLMKVEATDKDLGEKTKLTYLIQPSTEFSIDAETGIVYPNPGGFEYKETGFMVSVKESLDVDQGLSVNVVILDEDNVFVLKVEDKRLDEVDTFLEDLSQKTRYTIRSLSATLIVGDDSTKGSAVVDGNLSSENGNKVHKKRSTMRAATSYLHLVVYGLDDKSEVVSSSDIVKIINDNNDDITMKAEVWSSSVSSNHGDNSSDGSDGAVIALAVVASLLAVALTSFVVLYLRLRRNNNVEGTSHGTSSGLKNKYPDYDIENKNPLTEVQVSKSNGIYETPPGESPTSLLSQDDVKPENNAWAVLRDFDEGATDEFKRGMSREDIPVKEEEDDNLSLGGRKKSDASFRNDEDGSDTASLDGRKKSVVTFNENVERIEIE